MSTVVAHEPDSDPSLLNNPEAAIGEQDGAVTETLGDDMEEELDEDEVEGEGYESSSSPSTTTSTLTWITWFCSLPGHEYFCEVAEDFIEDDFNLTGLSSLVPFYKEAMEMVLDVEAEEEAHRVPDVSIVESSAELLYGLIHQRYIITRQGLQQMYAKFDAAHFGQCPRVYCSQNKLVPCGRSDLPGVDTVKLYCPSCVDMYVPPSSRFQGVDGAFFGTTFPHLMFQTYPSALSLPTPAPTTAGPKEPTTPLTSLSKVYVPRIYGFRVSERARSGPRMQWLRMRPKTEGELDWADPDGPATVAGEDEEMDPSNRPSGLFDDDNDDEEDESESEEEEEEGGAGGAAKEGDTKTQDSMAMSGVINAGAALSLSAAITSNATGATPRVVRPLPRASLSPSSVTTTVPATSTSANSAVNNAAAATVLAETFKRQLEAAKRAAAVSPLPSLSGRSQQSGAVEGKVMAVKTAVVA